MNTEQFSKRMIELLPQCIREFSRHECNYLSRGEITLPQLWTLEYLSRHGGALMSELADFLEISRPAATGLADRLIAQGLVRRENVKEDRRVVRINITAKGKKTASNIWEQKRRTLVEVFSQISPRDREQYLLILEQVVHILTKKSAGSNSSSGKPIYEKSVQ